jgi:hypothetical protein
MMCFIQGNDRIYMLALFLYELIKKMQPTLESPQQALQSQDRAEHATLCSSILVVLNMWLCKEEEEAATGFILATGVKIGRQW